MKEATGEASMTVIVIVVIGVIAAAAAIIIPKVTQDVSSRASGIGSKAEVKNPIGGDTQTGAAKPS